MTRQEQEEIVLRMLETNQVNKVASMVCGFEAQQERPRGLNVPWSNAQYQSQMSRLLSMMFEVRPGILGTLTDEQWRDVGIRAAMLEAIGAANLPRGFSRLGIGVGNMNADAVARMMIYRVRQLVELEDWADVGVRTVTIMANGDSCEACATLDGATYPLGEAPEIPHLHCTHKMGCRCLLSPVLDDD